MEVFLRGLLRDIEERAGLFRDRVAGLEPVPELAADREGRITEQIHRAPAECLCSAKPRLSSET